MEKPVDADGPRPWRRAVLLADGSARRATEAEVVAAIRAGDEQAYEHVFRAYYSDLCRFAVRYVRDVDLAEDIVQVVLGDLWIRREVWQVQTTIAAYLYGATRNGAVTRLRQLDRARRLAVDLARAHALDADHAWDPAVVRALELEEQNAALAQAIETLSDRRRTILLLRVALRLSYREIALVTRTSVKNVEVTLNRAISTLRRTVPRATSATPDRLAGD
jgi:RNA polymerase sigma-70 factor (ECF subfamily)